jgi:hypothetical protein
MIGMLLGSVVRRADWQDAARDQTGGLRADLLKLRRWAQVLKSRAAA